MLGVSSVFIYMVISVLDVNVQAVENDLQASQKNTVVLVKELKEEIGKVEEETVELGNKQLEMKSLIQKTTQQCSQEIGSLNQTLQSFQINANENQIILSELLKKIQQEEEVHITLEVELKKLSETLELLELQHDVILDVIDLLKTRRDNKTHIECGEVITAIQEQDAGSAQTRSYKAKITRRRKSNAYDLELKVQRNNLISKEHERNKLAIALASAKAELKSSVDNCEMKKSNLQALTTESSQALEMSRQSVFLLESDLKASVMFTEAVRLEIITTKNFITELGTRLKEMKTNLRTYGEDIVCYTKLKSLD